VLFGGAKAPRGSLKDAIGYVEQFDTLIGELTVRDMLMYTAQLRLPVSMSSDEKMQRVQEVIDRLGLGRCAGTVIGSVLKRGISGGQAKRVNIALALISRPGMIFLDEPTSGLDSFMANEVATCLSDLAREGRTVVCTIHSPTAKAFSLFDELLMLNAGRAIYGGPTEGALAYLESVVGLVCPSDDQFFSLPEWLVDITADAPPTEVRMAHSKSGTALDISPPPSEPPRIDFASIYAGSQIFKQRLALAEQIKSEAEAIHFKNQSTGKPGPAWQLLTLLRYRMLTHYKSPAFLGPRIGDKVMFGVLILSLYWDIGKKEDPQSIASTAALLYFIAALCGYGAAAFVPSLTLDRPLFYRELADGFYSPLIYYLSKFIEEATLATLTSVLFSVIIFFGCSLYGSFGVFVVAYFLTTMTGICLAYAVAALVPSMDAANALLPTYVTTCMYFGGLFLLFEKIPAGWYWFSWTSFLRYSWGAMMLNSFRNTTTGDYPAFYDEKTQQTITVLDFYGMEGPIMGSLGACLGLLAACTFFFATCGAAVLTFVRHSSR